MSIDSLNRLNSKRALLNTQDEIATSGSERELKVIKNELKILNDETANNNEPAITNASGSPYAVDQPFFNKEVVYNSTTETDWKEVKSYDELYSNLGSYNLKKLNII